MTEVTVSNKAGPNEEPISTCNTRTRPCCVSKEEQECPNSLISNYCLFPAFLLILYQEHHYCIPNDFTLTLDKGQLTQCSHNMPQRNIIVCFALLLFLCHQVYSGQARDEESNGSACTLSTTSSAPEVTPWNATYIRVTWEKVLADCPPKNIKTLYVIVNQTMNAVTEDHVVKIESEATEAFLDRSPCLEHTVYLRLHVPDSGMKVLWTDKTIYNKPATDNYRFKDLYSGLLVNEIVDNICQKGDNIVTIPHPPEVIEKCIKTRGDVLLRNDGHVELVVKDPKGRWERMKMSAKITNLPPCTVCKMNERPGPLVKAHNSSHLFLSWKNMFKGCRFEVKDVEVVVDEDSTLQKITEKRTLLVLRNPCVNHSVHVKLNFRDRGKGAMKSETTIYSPQETEHCRTKAHLGYAIGIPVTLILLCCIPVLFLVWRKRFKKTEERFEDEDENPVYGIYASDGVDTAEVTDSNEVYGGEEEEEGRGENEGQIMDNNPTYE